MKSKTSNWTRSLSQLVFQAGLLAGLLDILSAFIYYYIKTGKNPLNVLTYVSKVALGASAFSSIALQQVSGLLVHFCIAYGWTIIFFILYLRMKWMQANKFFTAVIYGAFVWSMMNLVILPLWNNKAYVFKLEGFIINCLILMMAIGLPLSLIASKHHKKNHDY